MPGGFAGNLIFTIVARMLSGNHLHCSLRRLLHPNVVCSRFPYNERQKYFWKEIFEKGERTGIKANRDTVAKTARRARNENNERVSQVLEFLTSQQLAFYFSRKEKL